MPKRRRLYRPFKGHALPRPSPISGIVGVQASSRTGRKLGGRYEIVELLDRGGTSEVYLANDLLGDVPVAIKWLSAESANDPQHRERFVASARSTMSIRHPAIGRVYAVEEPADEPPYLIMEVLTGESLATYLDRERSMPPPRAMAIAREVAQGLLAAHSAGIIHRDIKPGNLFLVGARNAPVGVKIIDFGLAKDLRKSGCSPASINLVLGTAQYMAPEQVLADPIDARTDIYAFGAVLFRMLTGQLPFDLDAGADLFSHQLLSPAPPPSWLMDDIDPRLERLILRCLRKRPENRYPSMQALLNDLMAIEGPAMTELDGMLAQATRYDPDVYIPRNATGRVVAEDLARHFGAKPPLRAASYRDDRIAVALDETDLESVDEPVTVKASAL